MYSITSINPHPPLQSLVKQFVLFEGKTDTCVIQKLIPANFQSICFVLQGSIQSFNAECKLADSRSYISGQISQPNRVSFRENIKILAVFFTPTGMYQLFGIPMIKFTDSTIDFESVMGAEGTSLYEKIFEAFDLDNQIQIIEKYLLQKADRKLGIPTKQVEYASDLINQQNGNIKLKSLLEQVYMCERNFQRCFIEYIGISPKTFWCIARIKKVLQMIESIPKYSCKDITHQLNYTDPAHFSHEFKRITGMSPTEYYRSRGDLERFLYAQ